MKDTPTKETMNIYLLNIPFAIVGVAIAIVPLLIGMKHQARDERRDVVDAAGVVELAPANDHRVAQYDHAA